MKTNTTPYNTSQRYWVGVRMSPCRKKPNISMYRKKLIISMYRKNGKFEVCMAMKIQAKIWVDTV